MMKMINITSSLSGYLSGVQGSRQGLIVKVLQEWWGLNDNIKALVDKFAQKGDMLCLAPDLYHGKVAANEDEASHCMNNLNWNEAIKDVSLGVDYLMSKGCEKVGVTGFCMGGALTIASCVHIPKVDAGVCFYGIPNASFSDPKNIKCPIQCHFGDKDTSKGFSDKTAADALEKSLTVHNIPFEFYRYNAGHAFMRQGGETFDQAAFDLAFPRTLNFLKHHLAVKEKGKIDK